MDHATHVILGIAAAALCLGGCRSGGAGDAGEAATAQRADLDHLTASMTGSFSSSAQAAEDSEYRDIRLFMVPIWPERTDGPWLYVEQAAATAMHRPYRQRVYRLAALEERTEDGATLRSDVFELPGDPLVFAGAHTDPSRLAKLTPDDLSLREGCSIYLRAEPDGTFRGSTRGRGCVSTLQGAAYATSEALITPTGLETWDRGFSENGEQAWGAVKGPYRFVRVGK